MPETTVIKVGGGLVDDRPSLERLAQSVARLSTEQDAVVVHGGGPQATSLARRLGHEPVMVNGRRVTSDLDLEIVLGTVCGVVNARLVAALASVGIKTVGVNGASSGLFQAVRRPPWHVNGSEVDFGHVGDIERIDTAPVLDLLAAGYLPVISTVGIDESGALLNINGDTTATGLARELRADRLLMVTPSGGLRHNDQIVPICEPELIAAGIEEGWITDGMRVKLETGMRTASAGVEVFLVNADLDPGAGTKLAPVTPARVNPPGSKISAEELLRKMIEFESLTGHESAIADFIEALIVSAGLDVVRHDDNVYCWIGSGDDLLLLNSHLDVVPASSDHPYPAFEPVEVEGRIYGRGAVDAKASGAAMLSAIIRLHAQRWAPHSGKLMVALTASEEGAGGYNGFMDLLPRLPQVSSAVIGEPTSLQPCTSQKGLLILKATATGKTAHAARAHLGDNAIEKAARDVSKLERFKFDRLHPDLGEVSVVVTTIEGGSARNVVPESCSFYIDIRSTPAYSHDELFEILEGELESNLTIHSGRYEPKATPPESRILDTAHVALPGSEAFGSPTVSDWAFTGSIPAIKLGPGDSRLSHTGQESIEIDELTRAVDVYMALARAYFEQDG